MSFETIRLEVQDRVGLITLNRPQALNALNGQLIAELNVALDQLDKDEHWLHGYCRFDPGLRRGRGHQGNGRPRLSSHLLDDPLFGQADRIALRRKPLIAAVAGYALGGGCELALMCDFICHPDNARFGQLEINLGVIPGIGGTQRLTRAAGKAKAMEMCLTGRHIDAHEAERIGLVAQVFPAAALLEETLKSAHGIAAKSLPSTMLVKESINRVFETSLSEGVRFERRVFQASFATADQKEGMSAFIEKRTAHFKHC